MKLEVEIPDPKFKPGDVVRERNSKNTEFRIYHIIRFEACGEWSVRQQLNIGTAGLFSIPRYWSDGRSDASYTLVFLADSYYDTPELALIRPGKVSALHQPSFDLTAERIEYQGTITTPDTWENLDYREKLWIARYGGIKSPLVMLEG